MESPLLDQVVNIVMPSPSPNTVKADLVKARNNSNKTPPIANKSLLTSGNYNAINPSADLKLPAEIFASDDSVSDVGVTASEDINMQNALQDLVQESLLANSKDKMLGGIKLEKPKDTNKASKKSKKSNKNTDINLNLADIKTELQDDFDWNNMTLATVNNNTNVNRFQSRYVITTLFCTLKHPYLPFYDLLIITVI